MKIKKSHVIIGVIVIVVAVLTVVLIQPVKSVLAMAGMKPLETQAVTPEVYAVKTTFVNFYLLKNGDQYIAFDAGASVEAAQSALAYLDISESDITAVFLTHTDYDHVAALPLFPAAEIYMAASNRDFLSENPGRSKGFIDMGREYRVLENNETITVAGVEVQCIFTPGHTDGSACYVADRNLFAGDTFSLKNGEAALFNSVFNMNDDTQRQSIAALAKREGISTLFTMHYGYATEVNKAFSAWAE